MVSISDIAESQARSNRRNAVGRRAPALAFWGVAVGVNIWLGARLAAGDAATLAVEGGPLENLQAILITFAFVLFLSRAGSSAPPVRVLSTVLAFVAFSFFFREVDLRDAEVPQWMVRLTSGAIRDAIFFVLVGLLLVYLAGRRHLLRQVAACAASRRAAGLWLCLQLLLAAGAFDEGWAEAKEPKLWEEALELEAYLALLFAARRLG